MKLAKTIIALTAMLYAQMLAAQGTMVKDSFFSEGIDTTIQLNIYLPPSYEAQGEAMPLYIFLHDCCISDYTSFADTMLQVLDQKIGDGVIEPLVVIWPNVHKGPFKNLHLYVDSPASGPFESVITKELLTWISEESNYVISNQSCRRVIGGFGMGADGAVRIAVKNPDLFGSVVAHHGGGGLALRGYADLVPGVLFESPQAAPAYTFDPGNGSTTAQFFGASVAFSPNMDHPPHYADFIVTPDGVIDTLVMENQWLPNHNPSNILQEKMKDSEFDGPNIYFDHGSDGNAIQFVMRPFGQRFAVELDSINYPYTYTELPGGYEVTKTAFASGLDWLTEHFCADQSTSDQDFTQKETLHIYPSPTSGPVTIETPGKTSGPLDLKVINMLGQQIRSAKIKRGDGRFDYDLSGLLPGAYFLQLHDRDGLGGVAKISIVK